MNNDLAWFVDGTLRDAIRQWEREQDFERAANRKECDEPWVRSGDLSACKRYATAVRHGFPIRRQAKIRGQCREQQFVRALCLGRIVRDAQGRLRHEPPRRINSNTMPNLLWQVRVAPDRRRSPQTDIVDPTTETVYEHKSVFVPRYVSPISARRNYRPLRELIEKHAKQVHRQRTWSRSPSSPIPRHYRHELVYQLEDLARFPSDIRQRIRREIIQTARRMGVHAHVLSFAEAEPWEMG